MSIPSELPAVPQHTGHHEACEIIIRYRDKHMVRAARQQQSRMRLRVCRIVTSSMVAVALLVTFLVATNRRDEFGPYLCAFLSLLVSISFGLVLFQWVPFDHLDLTLEVAALCLFVGGYVGIIWREDVGALVSIMLVGLTFTCMLLLRIIIGPWQDIIIVSLLGCHFLVEEFVLSSQFHHSQFILDDSIPVRMAGGVLGLCGLVFALKHYSRKMRRPWLDSPNLDAYVFGLFVIVVLCGLIFLSITLHSPAMATATTVAGFRKLGGALIPVIAPVLECRLFRSRASLDDQIEHRSNISESLLTDLKGLWAAAIGSVLWVTGSSIVLLCECFAWNEWLRAVGALVMVSAFSLLALAFIFGESKWGNLWVPASFILLAGGMALYAASKLVMGDHARTNLRYVASAVGVFGAVLLMSFNLFFKDRFAAISWHPSTWLHVFHPANCLLLSGLLCAAGSTFCAFDDEQLAASCCWVAAGLIQGIHVSVSWGTWSLTHGRQPAVVLGVRSKLGSIEVAADSAVTECDVLVCGASVSGLMLACQLGRARVDTMTLERRSELVIDARFTGVNPASRIIYRRWMDSDLHQELLSRAIPQCMPQGIHFTNGLCQSDARVMASTVVPPEDAYIGKMSTLSPVHEGSICACRYAKNAFMLRCMQSHQEAVTCQQARRHKSVQMLYGCTLERAGERGTMDGPGKMISAVTCSSNTFFLASKFLIGADGPGSKIGDIIAATFDGFTGLSRPRSTLLKSVGWFEKLGEKFGHAWLFMIARRNAGMVTLVICDPTRALFNAPLMYMYDAKLQKTASTFDAASAILGSTDLEIVDDGHWYWNFFLSNNFSHSNDVFLVGDAAHSWPPLGGTGGNTAFGDVTNLAWKLACVCNGTFGRTFLASYDTEVRQRDIKIGIHVLKQVQHMGRPEKMVRFLCGPLFEFRFARAIFTNMFLRGNRGQHSKQNQAGFQFGIKYLFSPIIHESSDALMDDPYELYTPCINAGAFLPDCRLTDDTSLHDHVHLQHYTVLITRDMSELSSTPNLLRDAFAARGLPLHVVSVTLAEADGVSDVSSVVVWQLYQQHTVLVVRPDLYVASTLNSAVAATPAGIDTIVTTITGRSANGDDSWTQFATSRKHSKTIQYLGSLQGVFSKRVQPVRKLFPNAREMKALSKAEAIVKARTKDSGFFATTTMYGIRRGPGGPAPGTSTSST